MCVYQSKSVYVCSKPIKTINCHFLLRCAFIGKYVIATRQNIVFDNSGKEKFISLLFYQVLSTNVFYSKILLHSSPQTHTILFNLVTEVFHISKCHRNE